MWGLSYKIRRGKTHELQRDSAKQVKQPRKGVYELFIRNQLNPDFLTCFFANSVASFKFNYKSLSSWYL